MFLPDGRRVGQDARLVQEVGVLRLVRCVGPVCRSGGGLLAGEPEDGRSELEEQRPRREQG